jgi:hypothetical protein
MLYGISSDGDVHQVPYSIGSTPTKPPHMTEDWKPFLYATNGPKMGPKLWETSVKYVNIRPELIENARAGKVI